MQVLFKLIVLYELNREEQNGYQIIKRMSEHYGKKQSPGAVFPLLERMIEDGVVSMKKVGRTNEYSLTTLGKKVYKEVMLGKEEIILNVFELYRFITDSDAMYDEIKTRLNVLKEKESALKQIKHIAKFKSVAIKTMFSKEFHKHEKEFESILKKATSDLEKMNLSCNCTR